MHQAKFVVLFAVTDKYDLLLDECDVVHFQNQKQIGNSNTTAENQHDGICRKMYKSISLGIPDLGAL